MFDTTGSAFAAPAPAHASTHASTDKRAVWGPNGPHLPLDGRRSSICGGVLFGSGSAARAHRTPHPLPVPAGNPVSLAAGAALCPAAAHAAVHRCAAAGAGVCPEIPQPWGGAAVPMCTHTWPWHTLVHRRPQVLFDVGDRADAFYIIESGSMRLEFAAPHEQSQPNALQAELLEHQLGAPQPRCVLQPQW